MKIRAELLIFLAAAGVFLSGCSIFPMQEQPKTTFCTLRSLRETPAEYGLRIGRITNDSGAAYKLRYQQGTEVTVDEYRQWADMPQVMTANILRRDFPAGDVQLNGNIFCWETDIEAGQVRFGAEWYLGRKGVRHRTLCTAPLTELSQQAIAEAFSTAIREWEDDIETALLKKEGTANDN